MCSGDPASAGSPRGGLKPPLPTLIPSRARVSPYRCASFLFFRRSSSSHTQPCHSEPIRCHPDPTVAGEGSPRFAQGKLREARFLFPIPYSLTCPGLPGTRVPLRDFLRCFGVVFPRRPHTDRKRAQDGSRGQRGFCNSKGVHGICLLSRGSVLEVQEPRIGLSRFSLTLGLDEWIRDLIEHPLPGCTERFRISGKNSSEFPEPTVSSEHRKEVDNGMSHSSQARSLS